MRVSVNTPSDFPTRLRLALHEAGKTQEDLAREVGVTLRAVQGWVAGDGEPRGRTLVATAQALNRSAEWFYEDEAA